MIEVEVKFSLLNGNKQRILKDAKRIHTKINNDTYYDNKDFTLTLKDWWLRKRNTDFELKLPPNSKTKNTKHEARRYEELTEEPDIIKALQLTGDDVAVVLAHNQFKPFAKLITTRDSYKHGKFHIDIDHTNFNYNIGELELLVENLTEVEEAEKELIQFLTQRNISHSHGELGKVAYYLQKNNPDHFQLLVDAGVISYSVKT